MSYFLLSRVTLPYVMVIILFIATLKYIYSNPKIQHLANKHRIDSHPKQAQHMHDDNNDILKIEIMIPSFCSAEEAKWRSLQRNSFLQLVNNINKCDISYHYFIANDGNCTQIQNESMHFNDIIILQNYTKDSWDTLQMKIVQMILYEYKYIYNKLPFDLLFKLDSDVMLKTTLFCQQMNILNSNLNFSENALYMGRLWKDSQIFIDNNTAWNKKYYNFQWYEHLFHSFKHYVPYMDGPAYLLSWKTVQIINNAINKNLNNIAFDRIEDTYIGHLLSSFDVKFVNISHWFDQTVFHCHPKTVCYNHKAEKIKLDKLSPNKIIANVPKKIALLFLTRDLIQTPKVWDRFFANEDNKQYYNIYVHPKFVDNITNEQSYVYNNILPKHLIINNTARFTYSLVDAS
eukprot:171619_1